MDLERLYLLRQRNALTQEELGKILGVRKVAICKWEKDKATISLRKLNECANYFDVSMDYLLKLSNIRNYDIKNKELDKVIVGNNIKAIRKQYNITQVELANILNTTHSTISAYEKGKTLILTSFAFQICSKYNISMDWLCGRTKNKELK